MRRIIFLLLQLLFLPVTLLGYIVFVISMVNTVRTTDAEMPQNISSPLLSRWFMHQLRVRKDEAAVKLSVALRDYLPSKLKLIVLPTIFSSRLSGYVPARFRFPRESKEKPGNWTNSTTHFIDKVVEKNSADIEQVVILSAGLDTRAYTDFRPKGIPVFEIDMGDVQTKKTEALKNAGLPLDGICFVSVDSADDWQKALLASGFDSDLKCLFLLEGSSYYLTEERLKELLRTIGTTCAQGSVLVFDFIAKDFLASPNLMQMQNLETENPFWKSRITFGLDVEKGAEACMKALLDEGSFALESYRLLGEKPKHFAGVLEALKL